MKATFQKENKIKPKTSKINPSMPAHNNNHKKKKPKVFPKPNLQEKKRSLYPADNNNADSEMKASSKKR